MASLPSVRVVGCEVRYHAPHEPVGSYFLGNLPTILQLLNSLLAANLNRVTARLVTLYPPIDASPIESTSALTSKVTYCAIFPGFFHDHVR